MSNNNQSEDFFGDPTIRVAVEDVWGEVFKASNKVIRDAGLFGFTGLEVIPNPNIHQMLTTLSVVDNALDIMLALCGKMELQYDATKMILNAKQQILNLESVANSLKANNRDDFDIAMAKVKAQAAT